MTYISSLNRLSAAACVALTLAVAAPAAGQVPEASRQALIDLYEATNGDRWKINEGWLGEPGTECEWFGVQCSEASEGNPRVIVEIRLAGKELSGTLPDSLGDLADIRRLILYGNDIGGMLPASLGSLSRLEYLDLARNRIRGTIPEALGELASIEALNLSENRLWGTLPDSLRRLNQLEGLFLADNRLRGRFIARPGDYPNLSSLDLSRNQFQQLAIFADALPALWALDVARNDFSGPFPRGIRGRDAFERIDLTLNDFQGELPTWLGDLDVGELFLGGNRFHGSLEPALEAVTTDPRTLFPTQPPGPSLRLDLSGNEFSGVLNESLLDYLPDSQRWINLCWNDLEVGSEAVADFLATAHHDKSYRHCLPGELKSPDISQSGSWFDPNRVGEGISFMILENGEQLIHWFTYLPEWHGPSKQIWMVGNGHALAGFDPVALERPWGGRFSEGLSANGLAPYSHSVTGEMDIVKLDERTLINQQKYIYLPCGLPASTCSNFLWAIDIDLQYTQLSQLAGTTCDNQHPQQWISGTWYNPASDGEGFVVEVLPDGRGQVYWFTYAPDDSGEQVWLIGVGEFQGNRLHVPDVWRTSGGVHAADFDPDLVELIGWGELTFEFSPGGPSLVSWDSHLPAYGEGQYELTRLARAKLADCESAR